MDFYAENEMQTQNQNTRNSFAHQFFKLKTLVSSEQPTNISTILVEIVEN